MLRTFILMYLFQKSQAWNASAGDDNKDWMLHEKIIKKEAKKGVTSVSAIVDRRRDEEDRH